jgi:hypothetical protein
MDETSRKDVSHYLHFPIDDHRMDLQFMGIGALSRTSDLAGIDPCLRNLAVPSEPHNYLAEQIQSGTT